MSTQLYIEQIDRKTRPGTDPRTGQPKMNILVGIRSNGKWINGFGGKWNEGWKQGDTVEVEIEQKGQYTNFKCPEHLKMKGGFGGGSQNTPQLAELTKRIEVIEASLGIGKATGIPGNSGAPYGQPQPPPFDDSDIGF